MVTLEIVALSSPVRTWNCSPILTLMDTLVSLKEIALMPAVISEVEHRAEIDPFYGTKLPIFVAPMTCLIDRNNWDKFYNSKVIPIYPVRYNDDFRLSGEIQPDGWRAMTLDEFIHFFNAANAEEDVPDGYYHICIDCANGHMKKLLTAVKDAKQEYGSKLIVMAGNIAHPGTYMEYCKAGVDYVRVGIGGNLNCETGSKTGVHVSLPYLLTSINEVRKSWKFIDYLNENGLTATKVVADGGVNTISKAMKCLALGADYVMMGTLMAKTHEACGEIKVVPEWKRKGQFTFEKESKLMRRYYGQASKLGQIDRFGEASDYEEGSDTYLPVLYTLDDFCLEFERVLRSLMSYTNSFGLSELVGNVEWQIQSQAEYQSFNK